MRRLTAYLARLFATDALILFGIVCALLWLVQCLRAFDLVSVKGQGIITLGLQALLAMPPLAIVFFYVCIGIGMARALQALQGNHELHIIHSGHGLGSLFRATGVVAMLGVLAMFILSNFVEPYTVRRLNVLSASVAADLVSATLQPNRFTEVTPGVVLLIGGRLGDGELTDFFADDRRDPTSRRTYIAESARVSSTGENYVIALRNGSIEYTDANGRFSEITFAQYDIGVDLLSQPLGSTTRLSERNSFDLVSEAMATGTWSPEVTRVLGNRMSEMLPVIGICLLVLGIAGFPNGKRTGLALPVEVVVLLLAFAELGVSAYSPLGPATGAILMIIVGGAIVLVRARPRRIEGRIVTAVAA